MRNIQTTPQCPCTSGKIYKDCCQRFHEGLLPSNAVDLMRSRYSAYALNHVDYIIATTHPEHSDYKRDRESWKKQIIDFAKDTTFSKLEILSFKEGIVDAYVTFTAYLKKRNKDATFTETSYFKKHGDRWLYVRGNVTPGAIA